VSYMGPGLELIAARRRMQKAALAISLAAVDDASGMSADYAELSDAARHLVLAQNAYDDYAEARERDRVGGKP
jgi:hypothetical protein